MTEKIAEFTGLQNNGITPESIAKLLDDNLKNVSAFNTDMKELCDKTGSSLSSLLSMTELKKPEINVINSNTAALLELKKTFASHKNEAQSSEIEYLQTVSEHLKHIISGSFSNIEQTAKDNTQKLTAAYDGFYETCKRFTGLLENNYDEKTSASLQSISDSLVRLDATLKSLDDSTNQLSETFAGENIAGSGPEKENVTELKEQNQRLNVEKNIIQKISDELEKNSSDLQMSKNEADRLQEEHNLFLSGANTKVEEQELKSWYNIVNQVK